MSRNRKLWEGFLERFGDRFATVRDYYVELGHEVELVDLCRLFPGRFESLAADRDAVGHQTV